MAIRASFRLLVAGLVGISTPIAISPACAESQSPSSDFFEVSAPSPPSDDLARPSHAVDTKKEESSLQDDSSVWVPDDFDPWAYAFAESSRLQSQRVRLIRVPAYSVAMNSQVKFFVDRFTTTHREVVGLWVRRSGQYLGMIFDVFKAKGIPEDLAFTAMIESGFNPVAVSRVGAKGLWQFMAPTARLYGLRVERWAAERLGPDEASGGADGGAPGQSGSEPSQAVMPEVDRVTVPASTDLRKLAASTGIPLQTLRSLNAVLVRGVTPPGRTWEVRVPSGTREAFVTALTPRMKVATVATVAAPSRLAASTAVHVVRARDTVSSIAKLYGVSTSDVVRWNNLENGDAIRPGDRLRVTTLRPAAELDGLGGFR